MALQKKWNAFTLSPTRWIESTNAVGIITQAGRYGGTFVQTDIAFEFTSWISVEFRLYLVMEFQRLKAKEQDQIGWTAKRELSKTNYRIHTDAIKRHLIPEEVTREQAAMKYAEEADVLNVAMCGISGWCGKGKCRKNGSQQKQIFSFVCGLKMFFVLL